MSASERFEEVGAASNSSSSSSSSKDSSSVGEDGGESESDNSRVAKVNACRLRKTLGRRATGSVFGSGFLLHSTQVGPADMLCR